MASDLANENDKDDRGFEELSADNHIPSHPFILFNGRTRCGKSTLMEWILWLMARSPQHGFDEALVFCPSASFRNKLAKHIPRCFMHTRWDENVLMAEIRRRQARANKGLQNKPMVFLADDCMGNTKELNTSPALAELSKVGRQYGITRFVACQSVTDLKPPLRQQADIIVLPRMKQPAAAEKVYKELGGHFDTKRDFLATFKFMTRAWSAMVLVNNDKDRLNEQVFWSRAYREEKAADDRSKKGPFRIGEEIYWRISAAYYSHQPLSSFGGLGAAAQDAANTAKRRAPNGHIMRIVGEDRHKQKSNEENKPPAPPSSVAVRI